MQQQKQQKQKQKQKQQKQLLANNNNKNISLFCFFLVVQSFVSGKSARATKFDFATLTLGSLKLLGDAHLRNGSIRLTRDLPVPTSGAGRALFADPVPLRHPSSGQPLPFSTSFAFSVTLLNPSSAGGGLAFLLSPDDHSLGDSGPFLGLLNSSSSSAIVAVEFDTLMDVEFDDINGNHVGVDVGSVVSAAASDLDLAGVDLKSGELVNAWVDFTELGALRVFVSYAAERPADPVLEFPVDLAQFPYDAAFHRVVELRLLLPDPVPVPSPASTPPPTPSSPRPRPIRSPPPPPPPPRLRALATRATIRPVVAVGVPEQWAVPAGPRRRGRGGDRGGVRARRLRRVGLLGLRSKVGEVLLLAPHVGRDRRGVRDREGPEGVRLPRALRRHEGLRPLPDHRPRRVRDGVQGDNHGDGRHGGREAVHPEPPRRRRGGGGGAGEFLSELSIIAGLRHRNLVRLIGWCHEKGEILLVYDYMLHGSLDKALFDPGAPPLPWRHRREILVGVASALAYLHWECERQVIHRDVKSSNVMLGEGYHARLGDFGLARQAEHGGGPASSPAPAPPPPRAPWATSPPSRLRPPPIDGVGAGVPGPGAGARRLSNLVEWVWGLHGEGRILEAVDVRMEGGGEYEEGEMRRVLLVGLACSSPDPAMRPGMRSVVQMLSGESEPPFVPETKPSTSFVSANHHLLLSLQDSVSDYNAIGLNLSGSSASSSSSLTSTLRGGGGGGGGGWTLS
uniref:non-specific serine/threonine protein kinase n=1 Tax=Ananas comosus var. bracteatus TaxID=296719 RepID=A0A6V7QFM0_ANACO|nr:unnamed protein product [Ananas comosus var. bracteatus]